MPIDRVSRGSHGARGLQQTFLQVGRMLSNPNLSGATINAAAHIVLSSMTLIGDFMTKTEGYRARLCGRTSRNVVSNSWQRVGWALFKKEELKDLKDRLHVKLSNISLLLQTAKFYERAPSLVAKYEEPSPPSSYSHIASEADLFDTPSVPANVTPAQDPQEETLSNIEARFARLEEILNEQRKKEVARETVEEAEPRETAVIRPNTQVISTDLDSFRDPDDNNVALALSTTFYQQPKTELAKIPEFEVTELKEVSVTQLRLQEPEIDVNISRGFDSDDAVNSGDAKGKTEMQLSDDADASGLRSELGEELYKSNSATDLNKKKPIKFKDAVGRKFTFPFQLYTTWAGIEELVRQAFLHVDVIGLHVAEGRYDLIGPNGEIILPQVWETVIEPDWSITMHMWPIPERRPPPRPPWERPVSRHGGHGRYHRPPSGPPPPTHWPPSGPPIIWSSGPSRRESEQTKGVLGWMAGKLASARRKVHLDNDDSDSDSSSTSLVDY